MLLAPSFVPAFRGLPVEYANWQRIFLVNVPVRILAVAQGETGLGASIGAGGCSAMRPG